MSVHRTVTDATTVHETEAEEPLHKSHPARRRGSLKHARIYRQSTFRHADKSAPEHGTGDTRHLPRRLHERRVSALHGDGRGGGGGKQQQGGHHGGKQDSRKDSRQQGGKQQQGGQQHGGQQQQDGRARRDPMPRDAASADTASRYDAGGAVPRVRSSRLDAAGATQAGAPSTALQNMADQLHDRPMLLDTTLRAEWIRQCFVANEQLRANTAGRRAEPSNHAMTVDMLKARRRSGDFSRSAPDNMSGVRQDLIANSNALRVSPIRPPRDEKEETDNALLPLRAFHGMRPLSPSMLDRAINHATTALNTLWMVSRRPANDEASDS
jgi:hypothetical protein